MDQLARLRELKGLSQRALAKESGVSPATIYELENGRRRPNPSTLRKLAGALGVEVADLLGADYPKAESRSSLEPTLFKGLEEERRAVWEAAVEEARRLRGDGRAQMWKALSGWRTSKQRGESTAARRKYLDEMGNLLQEVYDADRVLGLAYLEAALTQGGSEASGPRYLQEESRTMSHFYGELLGLVKSVGLSVRTGADATAAKKRAAELQSERPQGVEEPAA